MIDTGKLSFFVAAAVVLVVVPGPSVFYIVTRSLDQGRLAGIVSTLGVSTGGLFHVATAALGLSALLASSALAFGVIKYLGAAYLIYLGLRRLMSTGESAPPDPGNARKLSRVFYEGMLVNLLNPKTALFFMAFLPQFVNPSHGFVSIQVLVLGGIFTAIAVVSDGLYALLAGSLGDWFQRRAPLLSLQRHLSAGVYIALGVATAVSDSGREK